MSLLVNKHPKIVNLGLIGCGAMGSELARSVQRGEAGPASIIALFDQSASARNRLSQELNRCQATPLIEANTISELTEIDKIDLIVECASQQVVTDHAVNIVSAGKSMLIMSSGAMIEPGLMQMVMASAEKSGASLYIPSGAVGGIDALRASKHLLEEVTIISSKPPVALSGAPGFAGWEDEKIDEPTVIFQGSAAEAVGLFPANVNVAATVSLAGIGPDSTQVVVIADPDSPGNVHEIKATSTAGLFSFRFENRPHDKNPKTSFLAVLAAVETLRSICQPSLRVGT